MACCTCNGYRSRVEHQELHYNGKLEPRIYSPKDRSGLRARRREFKSRKDNGNPGAAEA